MQSLTSDAPPPDPSGPTWESIGMPHQAPPPVSTESTARALDWHFEPPDYEHLDPLRTGADMVAALLDLASERALGRPLRPRIKVTPAGLLVGEIDVVKLELPAYAVAGLMIDRFVIRAERLRVRPGLPPVLVVKTVTLKAIVSQENVDRWTKELRLPFRLRLTEEGVVTTTGVRGIRMSEVVTEPTVVGGFVRLEPKRASLLGMPAPLVRFLRGYLPLPPLPRDAKLDAVEPAEGELAVVFRIDDFEQPLTPDIASRLRRDLKLPLPGLG
jgi:hypothetical protein